MTSDETGTYDITEDIADTLKSLEMGDPITVETEKYVVEGEVGGTVEHVNHIDVGVVPHNTDEIPFDDGTVSIFAEDSNHDG